MLTPDIDIAVNEYCAREILKCIDSNVEVADSILHAYIKSAAEIIKNGCQVGPDSAALFQTLDAIYASPNELQSESEEKQFNFAAGAVYGATKFLNYYKEK